MLLFVVETRLGAGSVKKKIKFEGSVAPDNAPDSAQYLSNVCASCGFPQSSTLSSGVHRTTVGGAPSWSPPREQYPSGARLKTVVNHNVTACPSVTSLLFLSSLGPHPQSDSTATPRLNPNPSAAGRRRRFVCRHDPRRRPPVLTRASSVLTAPRSPPNPSSMPHSLSFCPRRRCFSLLFRSRCHDLCRRPL